MAALFLCSSTRDELLLVALLTPKSAMIHRPVHERLFEADIMSCLFAFDPLVAKDFFALRYELFVERGLGNELVVG